MRPTIDTESSNGVSPRARQHCSLALPQRGYCSRRSRTARAWSVVQLGCRRAWGIQDAIFERLRPPRHVPPLPAIERRTTDAEVATRPTDVLPVRVVPIEQRLTHACRPTEGRGGVDPLDQTLHRSGGGADDLHRVHHGRWYTADIESLRGQDGCLDNAILSRGSLHVRRSPHPGRFVRSSSSHPSCSFTPL